jgi:hypothetical protein
VSDVPVTSPELPANEGIVKTVKDFSGGLTMDLTDEEIQKAFEIIMVTQNRYAMKTFTRENLEALNDEITYRLAEEIGIIATVDFVPALRGEPPIVDLSLGKVSGDPIHKYGFDHEKKQWEVRKATERGEEFLGEEKARSKANV